jgi:hypothetical protein
MIGSTWLPGWLGWVLAAAYATVIGVHLRHVHGASAQGRFWHGGHVLMALGMIVMFLPSGAGLVPATVGTAVFVLAAVAMGVLALSEAVVGGVRAAIVVITTLDLAAMAFMFSPASTGRAWVSLLVAGWFVVQALGWATGHLGALVARSPVGRELVERAGIPVDARAAIDPVRPAGPARSALARRTVPAPVWRSSGHDLTIRLTLGAMALGMAYMFVAAVLDPGSMGSM